MQKQESAGIDPPRRVLVPAGTSDALAHLEKAVHDARATGHYLAVGSPNLDRVSVSAVTEEQLNSIRRLDCSPAGFQLVHRLLKERHGRSV